MSDISSVSSNYASSVSSYSSAAVKKENVESAKSTETPAAVYEPSAEGKAAAAAADRSDVIAKLKLDSETRIQQMTDLIRKMFKEQGVTIAKADDMWKMLADGKLEVDPATRAKAQEDIAEDGYWGVKQTSERMFEFAKTLSGGDPAKMEEMRKAFEKGYAQATETWGKELPELSKKTYEATQKLFDDYAASFKTEENPQ
ncbi:MAG TPA: hypothetical protein DCG85_06675 [Lachnospiraceae bacterium]|nr:hypothetical protein [Lachnospiraceae bacterium]